MQGYSAYNQQQKDDAQLKKQEAQTKRQEALGILNKTMDLRTQGYDVAPDQVASVYENPMGGFGKLFDKRTAEYTTKIEKENQKALKEQEKFQADLEKTKAETAKLGRVDPLDNLRADELRQRLKLGKAQEAKIIAETGKLGKGGDGKQMSATEVMKVNEGNQIPSMLKDVKGIIENNKDSFGPVGGRFSSFNPYNEKAQTIGANIKASAQAFGRFMEGGVLRKEDEEKYEKMFPTLSDTPAVAANKLAIVEKLLIDKQNSTVGALRDSGYSTQGVDQNLIPAQSPGILGINGNDSKVIINQVKSMSREDKIKLLQGGV